MSFKFYHKFSDFLNIKQNFLLTMLAYFQMLAAFSADSENISVVG